MSTLLSSDYTDILSIHTQEFILSSFPSQKACEQDLEDKKKKQVISCLAKDNLMEIFSYLTDYDLCSVQITSKKWKTLSFLSYKKYYYTPCMKFFQSMQDFSIKRPIFSFPDIQDDPSHPPQTLREVQNTIFYLNQLFMDQLKRYAKGHKGKELRQLSYYLSSQRQSYPQDPWSLRFKACIESSCPKRIYQRVFKFSKQEDRLYSLGLYETFCRVDRDSFCPENPASMLSLVKQGRYEDAWKRFQKIKIIRNKEKLEKFLDYGKQVIQELSWHDQIELALKVQNLCLERKDIFLGEYVQGAESFFSIHFSILTRYMQSHDLGRVFKKKIAPKKTSVLGFWPC